MNWSFSALTTYESCALRWKFSKIDRIPEPPRPKDNPLDRGSREHDRLDRYVKGDANALLGHEGKETAQFIPLLDKARELYAEGKATAEENWLFDSDWNICERDNVWLWAKLDISVVHGPIAVVVDHKTGRSLYKTVDHVQQGQLYAACTVLREPEVENVTVEFWYLDEGHIKSFKYTRDQALQYVGRFQARADRMMTDKFYRPNPNKVTCRYCPYSPRGNGHCPVGV